MTPRRRETKIPSHQPVRFYKVVALSFLLLTIGLLGLIIFMSSKRATVTITTKESPVDISLSVSATEVEGTFSTTTVTVSQEFYPNGDTEVPGEATGIMTVINDSNIAQPLVATTRFLSSEGVLFRLRNGITVPANGEIEAEVYADQEGASGNIGPDDFSIPGLNDARQQEVYGRTTNAMDGGIRYVGVLSAGDIEKAEKALVERAVNEASLGSTATTSLFEVVSYTASASDEIGTELSAFTVTLTAVVGEVSYNMTAVTEQAREALLQRIVDDSETIEPSSDEAQVSFERVSDDGNDAVLAVFYDGVARINPDSKQFKKMMFFGKSRDEARRYVLSLDHVQSVEIDFSPAWMQTIPHVGEHVNVIIKNVR